MSNLPPEESDKINFNQIDEGSIPVLNYELYKEVKVMRHLECVCDDLIKTFTKD